MSEPFDIKTDYVTGSPPVAADLNRRGKILSSQLPGVLSAFGQGVNDAASFLVTGSGPEYSVAPGDAYIEDSDGFVVAVHGANTEPISLTGDEKYIHIQLAKPQSVGQPETLTGDGPLYIASELEELPDGLLLAEVEGGVLIDRRTSSLPRRLAQVTADVDYDQAARAKGTVNDRIDATNARIDALTDPGEPVPGDGTSYESLLIIINALKGQLQDALARIAALEQAQGGDTPRQIRLIGRTELLRAEHNRLGAGVLRQLPGIAQVLNSAHVQPGRVGMKQQMPDGTLQRAHYVGGNWVVNSEQRKFGGPEIDEVVAEENTGEDFEFFGVFPAVLLG
jgi:hypothetical protein